MGFNTSQDEKRVNVCWRQWSAKLVSVENKSKS